MAELADVDLDALAPRPKKVKLGGKLYKLPGDMPMPLFLRIQAFGQRTEQGEDETVLLSELHEELLGLFKVHQPALKALPEIGVLTLLQSLGAIYGGGAAADPTPANRQARRQRKRTPSSTARRSSAATSG
jgi:hypothetical protein